jgi:capsular exopolysaccharide synthesis family protein
VSALSTNIAAPQQEEGAQGPQIDLRSIIAACLTRWKLIIVMPLLAVIPAYAVLRILPPSYKATTELLIFDPQHQGDGTLQKPLSPLDVDAAAMNTEMEIIQSKSLALRVAEKFRLDEDAEFQPRRRLSAWLERFGIGGSDNGPHIPDDPAQISATRLDRAADILRTDHLQVERIQLSYVLGISVTSRDPVTAQRLSAAISDDYLKTQREARQDTRQRVTAWLRGRIDDLQSRMRETEASIEKLKAKSGLSDTGVNQNVTDQQITDLNSELMTTRTEVAKRRAQLDQVSHLADRNDSIEEIPDVVHSEVINQLRVEQSRLIQREAELTAKAGDSYPEVIAVRARLAGINKSINVEAARIIHNMENSYDSAVRSQQSLEANLQRLTAARGNSGNYIELQQMRRLADDDRKLYESYLSQFNELSTRQTFQDDGARTITPAALPDAPSSPGPKLVYGGAGVLGLSAGLLLAFIMEYFQLGVRTGTDVERAFGYPVVGVIPFVKSGKFRGRTRNGALVNGMLDASISQCSEAVRSLRIGLMFPKSEHIPKVILITSAIPGEGKSSAAMLLAASSAASGQKTVLVDCDLRRQSISEAFANTQKGLAEVLTGSAAVADVIVKAPATDTDVIPAGSAVQNPGDLLVSRKMYQLIAELRDAYDYIVIDASPLLPVVDALVLATMVDKILMIVEWSRTPRFAVSDALKVLRPESHRIAGIVLNKVDVKQLRGYGYAYPHG